MKKILIAISLCIIMFSFSGCVGTDALNEIAIVQSIGIDLEKDDNIALTLQIYSPQGAGSSTAIDSSKNNSSIITTKGKTISEAIENATMLQGKTIFTGNNRVIVIGKKFAENGLEKLFSYFNRTALTRQNTHILMADKKASDIVGINIYQGILAAETVEEMVNNNKENGVVYECPYYWLTKNMVLNDGDGAMPIIKLDDDKGTSDEKKSGEKEQSEDSKIQPINKVKIEGTAIFDKFKFVGKEDYQQTRGMLLIEDKLEQSIVNIDRKDVGMVSVKIYNCDTKIKPVIDGDKVVFNLDIKIKSRLKELLYPQTKELTKKLVDSIEYQCEDKLKNEVEDAFSTVINEYNSDVFNLKDLILKYQKDFYKKNKKDIQEIIKNSEIKSNINLEIDRIGLESDEKVR